MQTVIITNIIYLVIIPTTKLNQLFLKKSLLNEKKVTFLNICF